VLFSLQSKCSRGSLPALTQGAAEHEQQLAESDASLQERHIAQSYPQLSQIGSAYGLLIERRVKSRMAPTNLVGHLARLLIRMLAMVQRARKLARKLEANRASYKTYLTIKYSGLFDSDYYLQTYPELRGKVRDPAKHYVRRGAKEGRNPSPHFSTLQYLDANPDVRRANINPLAHYIRHGIAEGRLTKITDSPACGASVDFPCSRDLKQTAVERLRLRSLGEGAIDPVIEKLHRLDPNNPSAGEFDAEFYAASYTDLNGLCSPEALRKHYEDFGRRQGRAGSPAKFLKDLGVSPSSVPLEFSPEAYAILNRDLQNLKERGRLELLAHFLRHGRHEQRLYSLSRLFVDPSRATTSEPASASAETGQKGGEDFRICCLAHVYYPDLWPELARHIINMREIPSALYVNLVDTTWTEELHAAVRQDFPEAHIYVSLNRGRDIGGFFALLRNIEIDEYDAYCLVHTKKSPDMDELEVGQWRDDLLGAILGSREIFKENVNLLSQNKDIGLIGAGRWRNTSLCGNADNYYRLLDVLGVEGEHRQCEYLSGTMMFLRTSVLKEIYMALCEIEFEDGDNRPLEFHRDGQIAHAVEPLIGNIVRKQGYEFAWR
jgi:hypothetical protein